MEIILKDIDTWIKILKGIDLLKDKFGSNIIDDAITFLSGLEKGEVINHQSCRLVELLVHNGISDIKMMKAFLESIRNTYRFGSTVIENLSQVEEKYGASMVAFINHGYQKRIKIATYATSSVIRMAHFARDVYPFLQMDFQTNGINEISFFNNKPFIIDDIDIKNKARNRVLYVADFGSLRTEALPLKAEMNKIDIQTLRTELFIALLEELHVLAISVDVNLIVADPSGTYRKDKKIDLREFYTLRSDGDLLDNRGSLLTPTSTGYNETNKVCVQNASFMVITKNINEKIAEINLIVAPSYLEKIKKILTSDLLDFIDSLKNKSNNTDLESIMLR